LKFLGLRLGIYLPIGIYQNGLNWYRRRKKNTLQAKAAIIPLPNRQYVNDYFLAFDANSMPCGLRVFRQTEH